MNRLELIGKVRELGVQVEGLNAEKASMLEREQVHQSEVYAWCREKMLAVHQMKYQFSKEVLALHQAFRHLNQEVRNQIERLRRGESLESLPEESPVAGSAEPVFAAPADQLNQGL